jgi:hypothetical protein
VEPAGEKVERNLPIMCEKGRRAPGLASGGRAPPSSGARRHGHGPLDLPLDYRSPWWAAVGDQVRAAGCSLSLYDPR